MSDSPVNLTPPGTEHAPPPAPAPPSPGKGSKLLTIGILLAAVAVVTVWLRRDLGTKSQVPKATIIGTTPQGTKKGSPAPDLQLKDVNGKTVRLSELQGKVVLVDFWATWCQPCTIMIPWFIEFQKRYGPQGLVIIGVAMDEEGLSAVKPYVDKAGMNYTVVLGNDQTAEDWGGIFGLPTSFVIDRQGRIFNRHVGLVSRSEFEKDIRSLL